MRTSRALTSIARYMQGAAIVVFIAVLYLARDVFIPMALGVLVAFLLSPLVARLQRLRLPNAWAVVSSVAIVLLGFSVFVFAIGSSVTGFSEQLPKYRDELRQKTLNLKSTVSSWANTIGQLEKLSEDEMDESGRQEAESGSKDRRPAEQRSGEDEDAADETIPRDGTSAGKPLFVTETPSSGIDIKSWAGGAASILGPIGTAGLVSVFAIFLLLYRDDLRDRVVSVISKGNYVVTTDAMNEASRRIGNYLFAQLILNLGYGSVFSVGLIVIGLTMSPTGWFPYVALLGTVSGLARFVPYIGPLFGATLPIVLSLLLFPGFKIVIAVASLIVIMELVSNNIVEPWLYGSSTGVSPMAVILAAVFWGWLWGPIGLLLATPLTVCVVVMGQYVPRFRFLTTLLSDEIKVSQAVRGYQRLLTGDEYRITEFIKSEAKEKTTLEFLDNTVIPTIKVVLKDTQHRELSDEQLFQQLHASIREAGQIRAQNADVTDQLESANQIEREKKAAIDLETANKLRVHAIPVRNTGELLTLEVIRDYLSESINIDIVDRSELPERDAELIAKQQPQVVVVTVIPPGGLEQTRYWCSALRKAGYSGQILVACLGKFKHYDRLLTNFRRRGATYLVTSASQLAQKLERISVTAVPSLSAHTVPVAPIPTNTLLTSSDRSVFG